MNARLFPIFAAGSLWFRRHGWVTAATVAQLLSLLLPLCLESCSKAKKDDAGAAPNPGAAQVSGRSIEFPHGNPQLAALQTVDARPFQQGEQRFTGRVVWDEDHTNRVFSSLAGRVEKISAEIGQTIKKGDDLALLRSPDFGQVQADYRKALGDFAQFDKTLTRTRALREHGAAAVKDVESAQADYDRGLAEKQRAELRLQMLGAVGGEFNDEYHLVAPIGGIIVDRNVNVGQEVRSDIVLAGSDKLTAPMFTITDPAHLWVQLDVPEGELGKLHSGQPVELRAPAYPNRVFPGKLDTVGAFLDPLTRVAHARASVDNADGLLKAEMYVSVDVKGLAASDTDMEVPARAVLFLSGKYYVFVETAPRKYERREVTVERDGAGASGTGAVVRGLPAHVRVVTEGSLLINDMLPEGADEPSPAAPTAVSNSESTPAPLAAEKTSL